MSYCISQHWELFKIQLSANHDIIIVTIKCDKNAHNYSERFQSEA